MFQARAISVILKGRQCHRLKQHITSFRGIEKDCISFKDNARFVSTVGTKEQPSILKKIARKIPFMDLDQTRLKASAYFLYETVADRIDYQSYFEEFDLPDTFYSWFVVTELHLWMISVRCMAEGDDGKIVRNALIETMWTDVGKRVKKLGAGSFSEVKGQIQELSEQLQAAFLAYDEGLQSDDHVLAGAIWRRLYQHHYVHPEILEKWIKYIRKNVILLEKVSQQQLFQQYKNEDIKWSSIKD